MINIIETETQELINPNNNTELFNNMTNNNTFSGGLLIGFLGGLIILGCLLPFLKLKRIKSNPNNKLAPLQQKATLIK